MILSGRLLDTMKLWLITRWPKEGNMRLVNVIGYFVDRYGSPTQVEDMEMARYWANRMAAPLPPNSQVNPAYLTYLSLWAIVKGWDKRIA